MKAAWYTLMPRGDYTTRNSFFEALCAGSIPVVFDTDYFQHCAYNDVIDYSQFVNVMPLAEYMRNESMNAVEWLQDSHNMTSAALRLHKLKLGQISHIFQYSLNPVPNLTPHSSRVTKTEMKQAARASLVRLALES
ncbi:g6760 [Coccomyxa viridis]|uniref:G6760 protein n=1 Tax=Coccomyxa viridis TaxID=1274662 RepID=A0ABP1G2R7_9CHLO